MNNLVASRILRYAGCGVLLGVLAVSSYAGGKPPQAPIVPVLIETVPDQLLTASTMEKTTERLEQKRREALLLLQSVIDDPLADDASRKQAFEEKTRIAARMGTEASLEAMLEHMGFVQPGVIMGEGTLSVVVPWQAAENEHSRMQIIDAAVSQSGLSAEAIKIILAKK